MPEIFRNLASSKLKSVFTALSFFLASSASAETDADPNADAQSMIITDSFVLVAAGSEIGMQDSLSGGTDSSAYLGTVGKFMVVPGNRAPEHIAFVKNAKDRGYVIENRIIVTCSKKSSCTLPDHFRAERLGKRRYEIVVNDYESWKLYMEELKSIDGVEKVSPSLFFGNRQALK